MATLESIAADVNAAVVNGPGYTFIAKWVQNRYQQWATRSKLKHLRQLGQVVIPAAITTGQATFTRDSATVTLDATATAACSPAIVGRYIRGHVVWYEILGYNVVGGLGVITLKGPFAEGTITGTPTIVSRYTPVDPRAAYLGNSFVHARRRRPLSRIDMDQLNLQAPYRPLVGSAGPQYFAEGPEVNGVKTIEVYPYPADSEALFYVYWQNPPELSLTEELSSNVKAYALKEGALIDLYRWKMSQALDKGAVEVAGFWRNEARAQETMWERYLSELIGADHGDEDGQFVLKMMAGNSQLTEIRTARDHVWSTR